MELLPADYVLLGFAIVTTITGLFRGFSGTLAFVLAVASAGVAGFFGWPYSASFTDTAWIRGAVMLVMVMLVFGIVRTIVRKSVNGLLAQPSDALFGALVGAALSVAAAAGWAWSGFHLEWSNIAARIAVYLN